jgi:endonuclease VIII-like 1
MEADFPFEISSNSRGKELMLTLSTPSLFVDQGEVQVKHIIMTMGMSGYFKWLEPGETMKNSHLFFHSSDGGMLAFVDVRRFGKWNWGWWNISRGPDPVLDPESFKKKIKDNLHKRAFDKPLMEVLMNQEYFNGIGNYLRAEIINRLDDVNPFQPARDAIVSEKGERLLDLCSEIPQQAYLDLGLTG